MIINLLKDLEYKNAKGDVIIELRAGMQFTAIRWSYVPKDSLDELSPYTLRNLEETHFVVYIKSKFIAIPKEYCEVPLSIGWKYNL